MVDFKHNNLAQLRPLIGPLDNNGVSSCFASPEIVTDNAGKW